MSKKPMTLAFVAAFAIVLAACSGASSSSTTTASDGSGETTVDSSESVNLTLGSWRSDDVAQIEALLAAFTEANPDVTVTFDPSPPGEYNAALRTALETSTGPDLFYVRSYATGRQLYDDGFIEPIDDMDLDSSFSEPSQGPWQADGVPYAVPFMAVSHGVYYNQDLFDEHGLEVPQTWDELIAAAETLDAAGVTPFANASADEWTMAEIVFMNLAPSFIGGREARLEYEDGTRCFDDERMIAAFEAVADIAPYLPEGQEALVYGDTTQLFLLGEAAMWFGGSWDIPFFEGEEPDFEWSEFPIPTPEGGTDAVTFHLDAGIGLNAASEHEEEAKEFLRWLSTDEATSLLASELPGFFPIVDSPPGADNPHAANFLSWNEDHDTDVRLSWPTISDQEPSGYLLIQDGSVGIVNGTTTPAEAAADLQSGLAEWYEPAQTCGG